VEPVREDDGTSTEEDTEQQSQVSQRKFRLKDAPYRRKPGSRTKLTKQDALIAAMHGSILAEASGFASTSKDEDVPFKKPRYDPHAPTRPLSMSILSTHDGTGDFSSSPTPDPGGPMRKSLSFAEHTGTEAKHAFEKIDEGIASPELEALYEQRHTRNEGDGLDGWSIIPRRTTRYQPPVRIQPEGWNYVRDIRDETFEELAMQYKPLLVTSAQFIDFAGGCNNMVAVIKYDDETKVCIRVPYCGSPGVWNEAARKTMRNTIDTMRYLRATTKLKVPRIIAWDEGFENTIKAPFILMECVEGKSVDKIWWDDRATGDCSTVSPALERKRQKILKSVAEQVVLLKDLKFNKYGTFALVDGDVTKPTILAVGMLPFADILNTWEREDMQKRYAQFKLDNGSSSGGFSTIPDITINDDHDLPRSAYQAWTELLDSWYENEQRLADRRDSPKEDADRIRLTGLYKLYHLMLHQLPLGPHEAKLNTLTYGEKDAFVLAQTDFQPQNIFVDSEDNVTGFIDWDYTTTKPRYHGWSQQPLWLCDDWNVSRAGNGEDGLRSWPGRFIVPTPARELERYRKDYARYILQACDEEDHNGDWRFTLKSHIFDAITMSLGKTEQMARVLHRLLVTNIGVYDWDKHLIDVGRDGLTPAMDTFYGKLFGEVFNCNPDVVKAELGMFNIGKELRYITDRMEEVKEAQANVIRTQKELVNLCKAQLVESRRQLAILLRRSLTQAPDRFAPGSKYPLQTSPSPDVSFHSFNSNSLYEMSGALRPPSPTLNTDHSASPSELLVEVSASRSLASEPSIWQRSYTRFQSRLRRQIEEVEQ
jgi:hypothetical protein